jgi:hypothetical protein
MKFLWLIILLASGWAMPGCKGSSEVSDAAPATASAPVPFSVVEQGISCAIMQPRHEWIRSHLGWKNLWESAFANRYPVPEVPEVAFSEYHILACFQGSCPSGGHVLSVESVSIVGDQLEVDLLYRAPGPHCMTTDALTQPFVFVKIPVTSATDAQFSTTNKQQDC